MTKMKTIQEIKEAVERLKKQKEKLENSDGIFAESSITTIDEQIEEFKKILALKGDLELYRSLIDGKYMSLEMDLSDVYGWVLGDIDVFDEFEE